MTSTVAAEGAELNFVLNKIVYGRSFRMKLAQQTSGYSWSIRELQLG
jgi:hypothetical protein